MRGRAVRSRWPRTLGGLLVLVEALSADGTRWTITAVPPPMQVGLTCTAADFGTHGKAFPRAAFCRTFAAPGEGLLPHDHPKRQLPAGWAEWASWKDPIPENTLDGWLDTITRPTILTYRHERDNDKGAAAQSRTARADHFARTRAYHGVIAGHRNRHLITHIPIQTLQWTMAASNPAKGIVKGDRDFRTWWAGVGDGFGVDAYVDSWAKTYPDPVGWLDPMFEAAEMAGRRLWLAELGAVLLGGDAGAGRAAWIRDVLTVLRERGCAGVAWWCAYGTPGAKGEVRDFHLHDKASADVWRAATEHN